MQAAMNAQRRYNWFLWSLLSVCFALPTMLQRTFAAATTQCSYLILFNVHYVRLSCAMCVSPVDINRNRLIFVKAKRRPWYVRVRASHDWRKGIATSWPVPKVGFVKRISEFRHWNRRIKVEPHSRCIFGLTGSSISRLFLVTGSRMRHDSSSIDFSRLKVTANYCVFLCNILLRSNCSAVEKAFAMILMLRSALAIGTHNRTASLKSNR